MAASASVVRPYALLGDSAVEAARLALAGAAAAWCGAWGLAPGSVTVTCRRVAPAIATTAAGVTAAAAVAGGAPERRSHAAAGRGLWLAWPAELAGQVQRLVFPSQRDYAHPAAAPAVIAVAGGQLALAGLLDSLAALVLQQPQAAYVDAGSAAAAAAPADLALPGSGALLVELGVGKLFLQCWLDHGAARALAAAAATPAVPPAAQAPLPRLDYRALLRPVEVNLPVAIGHAQVGLGSLMTLGVGDVIKLDTPAERPLAVAGPSGAVLFQAYLGTVDKLVALEVASPEK